MKIGLLADNIWGSIHVDLAEALAAMGHEVVVLAMNARAPSAVRFARFYENGVTYFVIHDRRFNPWVWLFDKLTHKLLCTRRFATELLATVRFLISQRDSDLFFVEGDYPLGFKVALASLFVRLRWSVGVHDTQNLKIALDYPGRHRRRRIHHAKQWVYRRASVVRANSYVTRDVLIESGCHESKIVVVPLHMAAWMLPAPQQAADLGKFKKDSRRYLVERYGLPQDSVPLAILCRVSAEKGIDLAIQALAIAIRRQPRLYLIVSGPDRGQRAMLTRLAESLGVTRHVIFTGNIEHADIKPYYAGAALHLAPSVIDTFNLSVAQAAAVGTYTLASETVGAGRWAQELGCGAIVPGRDTEAWADAMLKYLASEVDRQLPDAARNALIARFRPDVIAAELLETVAAKITAIAPRSGGHPA